MSKITRTGPLSTKDSEIAQLKSSDVHNFQVLSLVTCTKVTETRGLSLIYVWSLQATQTLFCSIVYNVLGYGTRGSRSIPSFNVFSLPF